MAEPEGKPKRVAPWQLGLLQGVIFAVLIYAIGSDTSIGKAVLAGAVFGVGMTFYEASRQRRKDRSRDG